MNSSQYQQAYEAERARLDARKCRTGYGCGNSCIPLAKECRKQPKAASGRERVNRIRELAAGGAEGRGLGRLRQSEAGAKLQELEGQRRQRAQELIGQRQGRGAEAESVSQSPKASDAQRKARASLRENDPELFNAGLGQPGYRPTVQSVEQSLKNNFYAFRTPLTEEQKKKYGADSVGGALLKLARLSNGMDYDQFDIFNDLKHEYGDKRLGFDWNSGGFYGVQLEKAPGGRKRLVVDPRVLRQMELADKVQEGEARRRRQKASPARIPDRDRDRAQANIPMKGRRGRDLDREITRNVRQQKAEARAADRERNRTFKQQQSQAKQLREKYEKEAVAHFAQKLGKTVPEMRAVVRGMEPAKQIQFFEQWEKERESRGQAEPSTGKAKGGMTDQQRAELEQMGQGVQRPGGRAAAGRDLEGRLRNTLGDLAASDRDLFNNLGQHMNGIARHLNNLAELEGTQLEWTQSQGKQLPAEPRQPRQRRPVARNAREAGLEAEKALREGGAGLAASDRDLFQAGAKFVNAGRQFVQNYENLNQQEQNLMLGSKPTQQRRLRGTKKDAADNPDQELSQLVREAIAEFISPVAVLSINKENGTVSGQFRSGMQTFTYKINANGVAYKPAGSAGVTKKDSVYLLAYAEERARLDARKCNKGNDPKLQNAIGRLRKAEAATRAAKKELRGIKGKGADLSAKRLELRSRINDLQSTVDRLNNTVTTTQDRIERQVMKKLNPNWRPLRD